MSSNGTHWGEFPDAPDQTHTITGQQETMAKMKTLPVSLPELVSHPTGSRVTSERKTPLVTGSPDFIHSLQLQILLKKAAAGHNASVLDLQKAFPKSSIDQVAAAADESEAVQMVRNAVILMCTEGGYDLASDSSLKILVESCCRFIKKICSLLASHRAAQNWNPLDSDEYLYQLLDETGFSLPSLHHFVKSISERKADRLNRFNRLYAHISESHDPIACSTIVTEESKPPSEREAEQIEVLEPNSFWDQSLDEMSGMTDAQILSSIGVD